MKLIDGMILTKQQRHTAYILMLAEAEKYKSFDCGLCNLIYYKLGIVPDDFVAYFGGVIEDLFPELEAKKDYRWPPRTQDGWKVRIQFLKTCIQETY